MKDIVEKEGSNLQVLRSKAAFQGVWTRQFKNLKKRLNDLETRKLQLEPAVNLLERRKEALETLVNDYKETLKKEMQTTIDAEKNVVTKISDASKDALSKISAIVN